MATRTTLIHTRTYTPGRRRTARTSPPRSGQTSLVNVTLHQSRMAPVRMFTSGKRNKRVARAEEERGVHPGEEDQRQSSDGCLCSSEPPIRSDPGVFFSDFFIYGTTGGRTSGSVTVMYFSGLLAKASVGGNAWGATDLMVGWQCWFPPKGRDPWTYHTHPSQKGLQNDESISPKRQQPRSSNDMHHLCQPWLVEKTPKKASIVA